MFIYCLFQGGEVAERLSKEGFPVEIYSGDSKLRRVQNAYQWFKRDRINVAHFHNASATIFGAPMAKLAGVSSIISTRHGLVPPPYKLKQERAYSLAVIFAHSKVVGVCEATSRNLRGAPLMPTDSVQTIYNGAVPASCAGEDLLSQKDGFTFITVGRLSYPKDPSGLITAFAKSYAQQNDLRLWIVGDGPYRKDLEKQVSTLGLESVVHFWGSRANVGDFLAVADTFTLISNSEGLPVSQLEAMAAGLPLVVSDAGAMPELVKKGNCGWIVPVGDTDALSRALLDCSQNVSLREQYGANSRLSFEQDFQLEKMALAYEELYQSR